MVKVRLSRAGAKKNPFYHVIVTDSRNPRDGKRLERIGSYDPKLPVTQAKIDSDRLAYWMGVGAKPSLTVEHLLKRMAVEAKAAAKTAAKA
ncbi:MAG: 30S ribosomal protein S16 [Deltaproteobacteria bacterium]|nr:30S ribosomal protein S16 [Deltaproteobacteria bacterium]